MKFFLMRRVVWAGAVLAMGACNRYPESYPPPEQRVPLTAEEAGDAKMLVAMNDLDAESYFIRDVRALEAGQWRWSGEEPIFHFVLDTTSDLKFVMDLAVAGATFKVTGPVTLTIVINDRELAKVRYDSFGEKHFEQPVDPDWLEAGSDTIVKVKVEPVWVSPADGTKLGVILSRVGFVKQQ